MSEYLKTKELCEKLGVDRMTVMRLTKTGKIPHLKVGGTYRFDFAAVVKALEVQHGDNNN